jgi:triacylglycerol esterase/lipase EstA (alpha/beta hydrolase family)
MAFDLRNLRTLGSELSALATAAVSMPFGSLLAADAFDAGATNATPVILVHGFLGDPSNFVVLRRRLAVRGITNFLSFSYRCGRRRPC